MEFAVHGGHTALTVPASQRKLRRAKISSLGTYVPERILSNKDLETMVDTNDAWIVERTGVRERHLAAPGEVTSHMGTAAARDCLKRRGITGEDIDLIIVASVTPDMLFPSTACLVQDRIGAKHAWGFDMLAACSSFVYSLQVGAKFIETGAHNKVLVIGSDTMSSIVDYTDRKTCILFGDAAGAVLLEPCEDDEVGIIDFVHEIDGSGCDALKMRAGGSLHPASHETVDRKWHYIEQDGQTVYKFAVRKMAEVSEAVVARNGMTGEDIALLVPHQANLRIINSTAERFGLRPEQVVVNIDKFGNTTAATIPLAMKTAIDDGRLTKGKYILVAAVGAGFTAGACLLRWEI